MPVMKTGTGITQLITLIAVTATLATTAFAQAPNYRSGTIDVTPDNVSTTTFNGVINSISGTAVVNITAPNVRVNTVSGGTLNVGAASGLAGSTRTTVTTLSGGKVTVNTTGALTLTAGTNLRVPVTNNGQVIFSQTSDGSYSGVMSGRGQLSKVGNGSLALTAANTYTGLTRVTAGTLRVNTSSVRGPIDNRSILLFDQRSTGTYGGVISGTGIVNKVGGGTMTLTGASTYTGLTTVFAGTLRVNTSSVRGPINNRSILVFDQRSDGTYGGVLSGAGTLNKVGNGTMTLTGANTHTGLTAVFAGTLRGNASSLRGSIDNRTVVAFDQRSDGTYDGVISGTGALNKVGGGILTLTGANTYTGLTTASAGTLSGNTTSLRGMIRNNAAVEFNQAFTGVYAEAISGTGILRKAGSGSVSFSGANSYTGATQINAGTLFIEGDQEKATGALTAATGATLGGKGIIGGATTIATGGSHRIGASVSDDQAGYQTFTKALTYEAGSQAFWRLTANTTEAVTGGSQNFDQAGVGTLLTVSPTATFNLAFNAPGSTVDWSDSFWDAAKLTTDGWLVFSAAALSAAGQDVFTLNPATQWTDSQGVLLSITRPEYTFAFYKDEANDDLYLNYIYSP
jgi:fibronectin-binding autotransporter adhesin